MKCFIVLILGVLPLLAISQEDYLFSRLPDSHFQKYLTYVDEYDANVANAARKVVKNAGCNPGDDHCKVQAVLSYVSAFDYQLIPRSQADGSRQDPSDMLTTGSGNCVDKTITVIKMLRVLHIKSLAVFIPQHIFPAVLIKTPMNPSIRYLDNTFTVGGKKYYHLEPTARNAVVGLTSFKPDLPYAVFDPESKERVR